MGNVIDLSARFQRKPSSAEIIAQAIDDVQHDWLTFAARSQLNDYFLVNTPSWVDSDQVNYLSDLTALGHLELQLKLDVQVKSPPFVDGQLGWVVDVRVGDHVVSTPPMPFEAYARAFAIVLALKLQRRLVTAS